MGSTSAFRHQPAKSLISGKPASRRFAWRSEPVLCAVRRNRFHNAKLGRDIDVPFNATPVVIEGVGVIVAGDDGFVRCLSADLSRQFWERRLSASVYASLIADVQRGCVIVCDTAGLVCAIDLRGALVWSADLKHPVFATPCIDDSSDTLTIAAFGDRAFALSLDTGETLYESQLPAPWYAGSGSRAAERNPYASPAHAGAQGAVFCSGSHVVALDAAGQERWRVDVRAEIKSSPIVVDGEVIVADVSGRCRFIDLKTGRVLQTLTLGAKVTASGAYAQGVVALGDVTGRVWGLDTGLRAVRWTSAFGAPAEYGSITLTPLGDFAATAHSGNCVCLDAKDGSFLWESSQVLGLPEQGTRMDTTPVIDRAGRLYAASYDGSLFQFCFAESGGPDERG